MSDELKQFYREIWAWVQAGCPKHQIFDCRASLCLTAERWFERSLFCDYGAIFAAEKEMAKLFRGVDCENVNFPFNDGPSGWLSELESGDFYQNPKRLDFIEEHAK